MDTVHIVNGEIDPMQFTFVESSCHAAGYTVSLTVEPMHGTIPAKSRSALWFALISMDHVSPCWIRFGGIAALLCAPDSC